jgi:hypothetical protein
MQMIGAFQMMDRIPAAILALAMTTSTAFAAPAQLYGKSVIVSWTENRMQTTDRDAAPTAVTASGQLSVYVSDKGRPFSRVSMSVSRGRGTRSGQRDSVQGDGSARAVSFSGNSMSTTMPRGNAGALLVSVTFDSGFQGCSAHVVSGKTGGAQASPAWSPAVSTISSRSKPAARAARSRAATSSATDCGECQVRSPVGNSPVTGSTRRRVMATICGV